MNDNWKQNCERAIQENKERIYIVGYTLLSGGDGMATKELFATYDINLAKAYKSKMESMVKRWTYLTKKPHKQWEKDVMENKKSSPYQLQKAYQYLLLCDFEECFIRELEIRE